MTRFRYSQVMRLFSIGMIVAGLLFTAQPIQAKSRQPAWHVFVDQFIESYFILHPSFAVNAGRHGFDGKLPDWSPVGLSKEIQWLKSERKKASQYRTSALKESERFERQYLLAVINEKLFWLQTAETPYKNPMFYSPSLDPNVYVSRAYAPIEQRLRAFIEDAKVAFATVTDSQLKKAFDAVVPMAAKSMRELTGWMELQRPRATGDFAMGAARFQEMLKATEGVNLPLNALEKVGRADLQRNLDALKEACKHYAPNASLQSCVGKVEAQKPANGTVAVARQQLSTLKAFVAEQNLVSIPDPEGANVAESPPFNRWNLAYIDIPGPFEHGLPSTYYVAPPDPAWSPAEQAAYIPSKADLLFVSAREVWPGHFLQRLHARHVGSKFGQLFRSNAFSEGWAHYTEELMWEAGLNAGDTESHIGQLVNALLRNVRFLSAIGLHTQGMTVEASEKMFRELAFCDIGNARQQAARGTFDPAYLNYTLGKLMIRKLREEWTVPHGGRAS
ncbi:DUF885 family protein [Methylomicrobium lacus]|uniref:DUF885 family protein n=1 Tax=Methylomicrobium lacus TaxID=136992 RepID=UPI0004B401E9|nr:DUF885 family protein [Methylomicrobium lacus]